MISDQVKDDGDLVFRSNTRHAEKSIYHCDGCCGVPPRSPCREEGLVPQLLGELLLLAVMDIMDIPLAEENLMPQSHAPSQSNPHPMTGLCSV